MNIKKIANEILKIADKTDFYPIFEKETYKKLKPILDEFCELKKFSEEKNDIDDEEEQKEYDEKHEKFLKFYSDYEKEVSKIINPIIKKFFPNNRYKIKFSNSIYFSESVYVYIYIEDEDDYEDKLTFRFSNH